MEIPSASQIKQWDKYTIDNESITSLDLMERAASRCAQAIIRDYKNKSFHIVVNKGNNGGDGLVIARKLFESKLQVRLSIIDFNTNESVDFISNLKRIPKTLITYLTDPADLTISPNEIIIDSIFGYGLNRITSGNFASLIDTINKSKQEVISIDIPSGLFADDNSNNKGSIIYASKTYTFQCYKLSFFLPSYQKYLGDIEIIDIGLETKFLKSLNTTNYLLNINNLPVLRKRKKDAHKGDFGHGLLVAGEESMQGAIILSSKACLRTGIGKLSVCLNQEYIKALNLTLPEAIIHSSSEDFSRYNAVGIGPGLGVNESSKKKLMNILKDTTLLPKVLDADALNLISKDTSLFKEIKGSIITPHIGEFKRLFGGFSSDEEKLRKQQRAAKEYQIFIVLKGLNTTIATPDGNLFFNTTGNSGMATAGSGDVLCGMILAFLTQGYNYQDSACLGVFLHGIAADLALENQSQESLIASDIIENIGQGFKCIRNN